LIKPETPIDCPFSAKIVPILVKVPTLPFLGSTLKAYSGAPTFDFKSFYEFSGEMRKKFGEFYSWGFPGFGQGLHGTVYSTTDPDEILKVIRAEGIYASGVVNNLWPLIQLMRDDNSSMMEGQDDGLLGIGERWRKQRSFLNSGMLDPTAAKAFIPGIVAAAQLASKGAVEASQRNELNHYISLCAFDMFNSFMFGELTKCADQTKISEENTENLEFCTSIIDVMTLMSAMVISPTEGFANQIGYKTKEYKKLQSSWRNVRRIGMKKMKSFIERYESGDLNEFEQNSYFGSALKRLENASDISVDEMLEICLLSLAVGIDTTSGTTAWNLVHVAMNPRVQEKLHEELVQALEESGERAITSKMLEKKNVPYLHAVLRENYRMTPPFAYITTKKASQCPVEVHGVSLPQGSIVNLENKYNDTSVLPDALEFKPERWLKDAVQARSGTELKEMDHPILRNSFGHGARRCPGSRVATNEMLTMLAQLVLDYEITAPSHIKTIKDVPYHFSAVLTPEIPHLTFSPRS